MKNKSRNTLRNYSIVAFLYIITLMSACTKNPEGTITVTTKPVTDITESSAKTGGSVTSSGYSIGDCGVCYGESHNPTLNNSFTKDHKGDGSFSSTLSSLKSGTTYYVRAYAKTSSGIEYGNETNFTTQGGFTINVFANPTAGGKVTGAGSYQRGENCTVTATANTNYRFINWTENSSDVSTNPTYSFTVTGSRNLEAHFEIPSYTISASTSPSTGGTVNGSGSYNQNQNCTLTATANSGFSFTNWTENDEVVSTNANYTFTVTGNRILVANFTQDIYTIAVSVAPENSGSISGCGNYNYAQDCTLSATATPGYAFTNWTENGNVVSTNSNYTFSVTGNRTLVANFTYGSGGGLAPTGAIDAIFSVSNGTQVWFSQGNLQYKASTNTWRFATNQYDYIGSSNSNISQTYSGWIDLFCWGTSGWNCGNTYYRPYNTDNSNSAGRLYGPPGSFNLTGNYANSDWGVYNAISNGDNQPGIWRTLTSTEWDYVFNTRSTSTGIRYAKACVNNVNGVILLPDNWNASNYALFNVNSPAVNYSTNIINTATWTTAFEPNGAVFLPAAGYRFGTSINYLGTNGLYWSTTCSGIEGASMLVFSEGDLFADDITGRFLGFSVRLVTPAE